MLVFNKYYIVMKLEELIQSDLLAATKEKNTVKVETLRLVKTEIMKAKTAPGFKEDEFNDDSVLKIMQKMCKEREETAEIYFANGREDLANKELSEKNIISEYLPKQATNEEVEAIVKSIICEVGASSIKDMGKVMKLATAELGSRSDGKTISTIVKECLNK